MHAYHLALIVLIAAALFVVVRAVRRKPTQSPRKGGSTGRPGADQH